MGKWVWSYEDGVKSRQWVGETTLEDVKRLKRRRDELLYQPDKVESDLIELDEILGVLRRYNDETDND